MRNNHIIRVGEPGWYEWDEVIARAIIVTFRRFVKTDCPDINSPRTENEDSDKGFADCVRMWDDAFEEMRSLRDVIQANADMFGYVKDEDLRDAIVDRIMKIRNFMWS